MSEFNCGKMKHIFLTEGKVRGDGREIDADDAMSYLPEWSCPEAKHAIDSLVTGDAKLYVKIDGSCGALIREADGSYTIYQRYDDKKHKFKDGIPEGYIPVPNENNLGIYNGGGCTHRYFLKKLSRKPDAKFERKIADQLYKIVDAAIESKRLPDKDFISVELVGENFNRTPGVIGNSIAVHSQQKFPWQIDSMNTPEQWLGLMKNYFLGTKSGVLFEGFIVEHKGMCWKIRSDKLCPGIAKSYLPPFLLSRRIVAISDIVGHPWM
jgi:hypothetical protein